MSGKPWFLVPARGGSKGIPRKNVRKLGGKPLIQHVLETLSTLAPSDRIVVSTDDPEIALLSQPYGTVHNRDRSTASDAATLDDVAVEVSHWILENGGKEDDVLITVQPTSPFIRRASLENAIGELVGSESGSIVSVTDDRHLRWTVVDGESIPLFKERVNRQWMDPVLAETGGVIGARLRDILKHGTRIVEPVFLLELDDTEALDIDDHADWAVAEYMSQRLRIVIRADASPTTGMGHMYRAFALATEWASHEVTIATVDKPDGIGTRFLEQRHVNHHVLSDEPAFQKWLANEKPSLVVYDILDTNEDQVARARQFSGCVVCFEDRGPGSKVADLVINDLYPAADLDLEHQLAGIEHAILAPSFETVPPRDAPPERVHRIVVSFGGTDPSRLTKLAARALRDLNVSVDVVLGPGYVGDPPEFEGVDARIHRSVSNMALLIREADLAITSAGRTVTEVLSMGVIPIVLCQNAKELTHTHASGSHGVLNLGLGRAVDTQALRAHLELLIEDRDLRAILWQRGRKAIKGRSNAAVCRRILERYHACVES